MSEIEISCRCGAFAARVRDLRPVTTNRLICYCASCQRALRGLDRADLFEPGGGTDYVQIGAGQLNIERGAEHLACRRMSAKGPLRWHVACCDTPVGNTLPVPFFPTIAFVRRAFDLPEEATGPALMQAFRRDATQRVAKIGLGRGWPAVLGRFMVIAFRARRRGDHRTSPFFDTQGRPVAPPQEGVT